MTHETPHQEAPASLADGLAAIARELRAMAQAQQAEAGIAAAMHAAVLCLLVSFLVRLADMAEAWQQGRLTLPPAPQREVSWALRVAVQLLFGTEPKSRSFMDEVLAP